jgi:uncharacterized surface protein with fasciclin (FAS1) repeats
MNRATTLLMIACLSLSTITFGVAADETQDIPANAAATGSHESLVAALTHAGLVETLQGDGPFTVFAPTDAAFEAAGIDLAAFDSDEANATLADILLYHVIEGAVDAANVTDGLVATTVNGDNVTFTVTNGTVMINNATVTTADVIASNGIIHVIDTVLTPPQDEAPAPQGPPGVICYNVVTHTIVVGADEATCGAYVYLEDYEMNGQNVTGCYNGVTHAFTNTSQAVCEGYMWVPAVNIAMTAAATTLHTSLVAALTAADLVATVSGTENYTVFAPTDEAFAAAGIDLDTFDTDEEIAALADILLYHVVAGTVASADIAAGTSTVTAANGDDLTIVASETGVTVNGATVTIADVPASNGVIHVIDAVLTPPADEVPGPFDGIDCAVTIGVSAGYEFTLPSVTINVGETVCWSWEDASMPHNVREVTEAGSSTYVENGVSSGAAATTVAFHHTFNEDTSFYYACEPHVALNMFGEVIVGDGGPEPAAEESTATSEDTPGFLVSTGLLAFVGAAALMGRQRRE